MTHALTYFWVEVWPNLAASAMVFTAGSIWHLRLMQRILKHHERRIDGQLTAHRQATDLATGDDEK